MPVGTRVGRVCRHLQAEVGVIIFTRRNPPSLTFVDTLNPGLGRIDGDIPNIDGKPGPVMKLRDYGELLSRRNDRQRLLFPWNARARAHGRRDLST